MSLQLAAQHLASRGRGPDTTLVHMAPQEVAGLQALAKAHGGTLTVNPDTGLPEAGFLSSILPTVIGAGLSIASGGTLTPMMAGLMTGAGYGLASGNMMKGLQAGLGAFGGAGLGAGLAGLGANTAASTLGAAGDVVTAGMPEASAMDVRLLRDAAPAMQMAAEPVKTGVSALMEPGGFGKAIDAMGGGSKALQYGLAAAAPVMADMMVPTATQVPKGGPNPYEYTYDPTGGQYTRVPVGTRDAMAQTPRMFYAAGGPIEEMSQRNEALTLMADGGQMYAAGGISHLGDYSDGGRLLKGPGDGVSDSIPATIADKRPARLADGEFVVPARIVSELGNGSTEAGARKLYAMMDRIQKARSKTVGKDRVAVNSRADKALPA